MNSEQKQPRSLRDIELAVEAEGREWMRQRLEQELQKEADLHGGFFPPQRPTRRTSARASDADAHRRRGC
jgi:hypothetical protein